MTAPAAPQPFRARPRPDSGRRRARFAGRRRLVVDLRALRAPAAALLAAGLVLPVLPGDPGVPCPWRALTGAPCPLCGVTRSVAAAVSGRWADALALNPAGLALVVAAAAVLLLVRRPARLAVPAWAAAAGVAALWAWQLWRPPPV